MTQIQEQPVRAPVHPYRGGRRSAAADANITASANRHERRRNAKLGDRADTTTERGDEAIPDAAWNERIVRERECKAVTGLSRMTRWRLERAGRFPRKQQLSPNCSGWLRSEIQAWIAARAKAAV